MNVTIETIPHESQRYETPADWLWDPNQDLRLLISDMGDWKYTALIALHEFVEAMLCKDRNIIQEVVDEFDKNYEEERKQGKHSPQDEPGDDPAAPYRKEHFFATNLERLFAAELGVDWNQYSSTVESLSQNERKQDASK